MASKKLNSVQVLFEDEKYNYWTSVSAETTKESATDYFKGQVFNLGQLEDNLQTCIGINFIDRNIDKTPAAKMVLQLLDSEEDPSYTKALKMTLEKFPNVKKEQLEKELDKYI